MTDGTSQGLFIVVAIVIFGIFVVLAYILFEDTLSPALANMFSDATEKSQARLDGLTELDISKLKLTDEHGGYIVFDFNRTEKQSGNKFPSYSGMFGTFDSDKNLYVMPSERTINDTETVAEDLFRIFVQQKLEDKGTTPNVIGAKLRINNKEVDTEILNTKSSDDNYNRWYIDTGSIYLELNKPYTFELWLYTDSNEFLELKKTIIIK